MNLRSKVLARPILLAVPFALVVISLILLNSVVGSQSGSGIAMVADMSRTINSGADRYLERLFEEADEVGATVLILELDTPGGSLDATRAIVAQLLDAPIPVVVYVSPQGAQAASAGTFVAAAANILAMSPVSNIGAASPVDQSGEDLPATLDAKVREDASALIRSIAEARNRNVEALEATVLSTEAYSANEAVELEIADLVATDVPQLLSSIDGTVVEVQGDQITLNTSGVVVQTFSENIWETVVNFLADPSLAYLLLVLGILGIVLEIVFFGTWVAGVLGLISVTIGGLILVQLPFSWVGVLLLVLALVLMVVETQVPGWGIFGLGSIIALILGGVFLFNGNEFLGVEGSVNIWVLVSVGVVATLLLAWAVYEIRLSQSKRGHIYKSPHLIGALVGSNAVVTKALDPEGEVHVNGEYWGATLDDQQTTAPLTSMVKVLKVLKDNQLLVKASTDEENDGAQTGESPSSV